MANESAPMLTIVINSLISNPPPRRWQQPFRHSPALQTQALSERDVKFSRVGRRFEVNIPQFLG
jgi:hypothetical protein